MSALEETIGGCFEVLDVLTTPLPVAYRPQICNQAVDIGLLL